ncbi:hypothetical protein ACFL9U_06135 [Thermodesulfobacteriota bacterium]
MKKKNDKSEGPLLEALTHRLSQCPREFLEAPRIRNKGRIHVDAVVSDLITDMTSQIQSAGTFKNFKGSKSADAEWLNIVLVACWLLHDDWFLKRPDLAAPMIPLLRTKLTNLSKVITAEQCVLEPDRREELVRLCLDELGLYPRGETPVQAEDRLKALDSIERDRVMRETRRAEEHARKVREAMRKRQAREAAAKVTRE